MSRNANHFVYGGGVVPASVARRKTRSYEKLVPVPAEEVLPKDEEMMLVEDETVEMTKEEFTDYILSNLGFYDSMPRLQLEELYDLVKDHTIPGAKKVANIFRLIQYDFFYKNVPQED